MSELAQAGLKLAVQLKTTFSFRSSCLCLLNAGIADVNCHAQSWLAWCLVSDLGNPLQPGRAFFQLNDAPGLPVSVFLLNFIYIFGQAMPEIFMFRFKDTNKEKYVCSRRLVYLLELF